MWPRNISYLKLVNQKKLKKRKIIKEPEFTPEHDNTISLNAETTLNLFADLDYDLKGVRAGKKGENQYILQNYLKILRL